MEQEQNSQQEEKQVEKFEFDFEEILNTQHWFPPSDPKDMNYHRMSIAPMLDVTNPHWRFLFRLISKRTTLYTEMIHSNALEHIKDRERTQCHPIEHPVVFQLGGCDPEALGKAAKIAEELGYDEINLNCGCPSARVQCGAFGACLMKEPELVAQSMKAIKNSVSIPCTVKHRIGVDDEEGFEFTKKFIKTIHEEAGITHFQAHARKAFLKGLNPAQNRNIPPLHYDVVYQLKQEFPDLDISINGGIKTYSLAHEVLDPKHKLLGCMVGRWAQDNIWNCNDFDRQFYGVPNPTYSRREILQIYGQYGDYQLKKYPFMKYQKLIFPILGLFNGERSQAQYRRFLSAGQDSLMKRYPVFSDLVQAAIDHLEKFNKEALEQRPPKTDQDALEIAKVQEQIAEHTKRSMENNPDGRKKHNTSKYQQKMEKKIQKKQKILEVVKERQQQIKEGEQEEQEQQEQQQQEEQKTEIQEQQEEEKEKQE